MKNLISKLVLPVYLLAMVFFSWAGFQSFLNASSILKDHSVIKAPIKLISQDSRTKKGHTTYTYNFKYDYTVNGKKYSNEYSAVNEKGQRYVDNPVIEIAYANSNPSKAGALHVLERQNSLWGLLKRILLGGFILGVVAIFVYGWAAPEDEEEDSKDEKLDEAVKA